MHRNPSSDAELNRRLSAVRQAAQAAELDAVVLSQPENIFYLTGLDHWGFFAPHMLIVPLGRQPVLVTRAMEHVAIANMVRNAKFRGHADNSNAATVAAEVLREMGLADRRLGFEAWSAGLPYGAMALIAGTLTRPWSDVSGMVDHIRQVKSAEEQACLRRAAAAADAGTTAAVGAALDGANEHDVAAACLDGMTRAGGEPAGFGPFIRPRARMGEEHTTWGHTTLRAGDAVFLEIAGCVARLNAPNGRFVHLGEPPEADRRAAHLARQAYAEALAALKPGTTARKVYEAWQRVLAEAGFPDYHRHHCGYAVGIAFPPAWTGGNHVVGLRRGSDTEIREGMSFHLMSWLTDLAGGDFFISNTVLVGPEGAETLTRTAALPFEAA